MLESNWQTFNQQYLMTELERIRLLLASKAEKEVTPYQSEAIESQVPSALEQLCLTFGLSSF